MKKIIGLIVLCFVLLVESFAQIGSTIPNNRRVDWTNAGLQVSIPSPSQTYNLKNDFGAIGNGIADDTQALVTAINTASNQMGISLIYVPPGQYRITQEIHLKSNIIIRGAGPVSGPNANSNGTLFILDPDNSSVDRLFKVYGLLNNESKTIYSYNSSQQRVTLSAPFTGNPNLSGRLAIISPSSATTLNQVGTVVSIDHNSSNYLYLTNDIDMTWSLKSNSTLEVRYATPLENIGFENFSIEQTLSETSNSQRYIDILRSKNIWISNIESFKPHGNHIVINYSNSVEIRNSYIHESWNYEGGYGYGVAMGGFTTNCLIENNIFKKTRHAMLVQYGANRNVFVYNYARENSHCCFGAAGDINVHGDFPYANLFEGNRVDRIDLDDFWATNGSYKPYRVNGYYNTFFRNYTYFFEDNYSGWDHGLRNLDTDYTNIIGNETKLTFDNAPDYTSNTSSNILDLYGKEEHVTHPYYPPIIIEFSHLNYQRPTWYSDQNIYLSDKSYFYSSKPSFFNPTNITWPAIGPRLQVGGVTLSQDIPARWKYCNTYLNDCSDYPNSLKRVSNNETQDKIASFELYQNYPNPFNPVTTIKYDLPKAQRVKVEVYDILGKSVAILVDDYKERGTHSVTFDASTLSTGVYYYMLETNTYSQTKKLTLIK